MSERQAQRFMKITNELDSNATTSSVLGLNALYQIATLPEPEREKERCYMAFILSLLISIRKAI